MKEVKEIIEDGDFSANAFALGTDYANWETDEVMKRQGRLRSSLNAFIIR